MEVHIAHSLPDKRLGREVYQGFETPETRSTRIKSVFRCPKKSPYRISILLRVSGNCNRGVLHKIHQVQAKSEPWLAVQIPWYGPDKHLCIWAQLTFAHKRSFVRVLRFVRLIFLYHVRNLLLSKSLISIVQGIWVGHRICFHVVKCAMMDDAINDVICKSVPKELCCFLNDAFEILWLTKNVFLTLWLKDYYDIVGESRPLSAFVPTHADCFTKMHFFS